MTYTTIPGDCIDRVTAQNGERGLSERLETPRLAPKVTLNRNWQSQQQQQQPTSDTDVPSLWKQETKSEDQAEEQDLGHTTSDMDMETHLGDKMVSTNAFLKNEVVKEELTDSNTKAIERINIGSNKICIREDLAEKRCCLAKNPAKLFSRWVMWNSLN